MRNQTEWAKKHRNGYNRARAIVTRQDKINPKAQPSYIKYKSEREEQRRKRQIECGQLKTDNGLIV